jgi:hypothetical protein
MYRGSSSSDQIIVGVMTDPTDPNTFVAVDTVYPGTTVSTWVERSVAFNSYEGNGRHIAFKNEFNTSSSFGYIDNLNIDIIPHCQKPQFVTLSNITAGGCNVSWTPAGDETSWEVVAVPANTPVASGTPVTASTIPFTLTNLNDDTQYDVYVRANCTDSTHSPWSIPATFTTEPLCTSALNVTVSQVTGTSALVSWDNALYGATSYKVGYSVAGQNSWSTHLVTGNQYMISGLSPLTDYDVMVLSVCPLGNADTVFTDFTTHCLSGGTAQIGDGTGTTYQLPLNNYYSYSYSQQIFLASEMYGAGTIDSIAFEYAYTLPTTNKNNVSIYLGHTSKNAFVNTNDYISSSSLQLVYTGDLNCQEGWNTFVFSTPFQYNGIDNLVLVVDDNSGAFNSNSHTFHVHDAGANRSVYYYSDYNNPNPSNPMSGNPINSISSNRSNVRFYIPCDNMTTCIKPNAYVSGIGSGSLTVTWAPGSTDTLWEMQYCIDTTNWISEGLVTSPHTIGNLASDTRYQIRLRSVCGEGDFSSWTLLEERTACSAVNIPFTEDFDDAPGAGTGNMITCWTTGTNYGSSYPYTSSAHHHSGNYSVYFYASSAYYSYLASPQFTNEVNMSNLQIRFWAYKTSPNYYIQVGVMTDPNDYNTFVQIGQNFSPNSTSTWEMFEVNTSSYTGNGKYLAFRAPQNITDYIYIDDITVDLIPACQHVSNIAVDSATLTPHSTRLSWTAGSSETHWEVVYGLSGTISDPSLMLPTIVSDTPSITLSGLSASSSYDVFVRAVCSASESSYWMQYTFNTACGAITALPYSEDFDYMGTGSASFPNCWIRHNNYSTTSNYPYISGTYHHSGNASLYFYNSTSTYSMAVLPAIDVTTHPINTLQVSFMMRSTSSITSGIQVGVMTDSSDASTFMPLETLHNSTTSTFEEMIVPLSNYTGNGKFIALKLVNTSSSYSVYLDDLVVELQPSCKKPLNLAVSGVTHSEADLSWTSADSSNAGFSIAIGTNDNFDPDTCTTLLTSTTTSYHFINLSPNTTYHVRVRTNCNSEDHSAWSDAVSFMTLPGVPSSLPYFSNFNNTEEANSWSTLNTTVSNKWYIGQPAGVDHKILYVSSDSGATASYINSSCKIWAFRDLNFPTANEYEISFKWKCQGESSYDFMYAFLGDPNTVEASTNNMVTPPAGTIQIGGPNHKFNLSSDWTWHYQSIDSTIGSGMKRLYFVWRNDPSVQHDPAIMIDSIYVKALSCSHPHNLSVSNITTTTADFIFSKNDASDAAWEYVVCAPNVNMNNESPVAITDTAFTVSNLTASSDYVIYVRTSCGNGNHSSWISLGFTTECDVISSLPYSEGFDDYGTGLGTYPKCWSKINTYTSDRPFIHSTNYEGAGSLYFYAGAIGTYNIAITPKFDDSIEINTLKANFMYRASGANDRLIVGVMSNDNESTFVAVDTILPDTTASTWVAKEVSFRNYTGNGQYIAFRNGYTTSAANAYIDNLVISIDSTIPPACNAPTDLIISDITESGATISWTAGGSETAWNVQYKEVSSDIWSDNIAVTTPTHTFTGLTPNTQYDVRVQADCGDNSSEWVDTSFNTPEAGPAPCETPTGLTTGAITSESIEISWNDADNVNSWYIQYRAMNGTPNFLIVYANSCTLTGLTPETTYQILVQADCGDAISNWTSSITATTTVGIENHLQNSISLYPNPANDVVNVQCTMNNVQIESIEVFDVYGKLLQTVSMTPETTTINVSGFAAGMYFVRVTTEQGVATKSFVKK